MRVFVAGASGVIGRVLVPLLMQAGHSVITITRSRAACEELCLQGVKSFVCDVYDDERLQEIFWESSPDAVVNQLTNIPADMHPRRIARDMAATNRLRTEGTRLLLHAARLFSVRRFLSQSISFAHDPGAGAPAGESAPLYLDAPRSFRETIRAVAECENATLQTPGIDGVVLRYGYFYGPGTVYARGGSFARGVLKRAVPVIGNGSGVFSFVHVADAAAATLAALESDVQGTFHIVDDDPAPVSDWLPYYAHTLGAPPPRNVPALLGRLVGGAYATYMMLQQCGAKNDKARSDLSWRPRFSSWREGFKAELEDRCQPQSPAVPCFGPGGRRDAGPARHIGR
ncbi:MAG: NAD(P)-dependent oxidoreductase [Woeseiaceae bacterium]|nr:NAD(P)-dependent oxidoreductase [Woeseiaceae bacterium]